jgi:hypothetical protein
MSFSSHQKIDIGERRSGFCLAKSALRSDHIQQETSENSLPGKELRARMLFFSALSISWACSGSIIFIKNIGRMRIGSLKHHQHHGRF